MKKCNHNSTSYAYIVKKITDKRTDKNKIYIDDYLNDADLQQTISNNNKIIVCKNGHKLIKYKSNIRKSHFKHDSLFKHDNNLNIQPETQWHISWKNNFEITELEMPKKEGCKKSRRADASVNNKTLEFQHSYITSDNVSDRCNDHKINGFQIMWIIDCTDDTVSLIYLSNGYYLLKFLKNEWKYSNFICCEYIYLDCGENIIRIQPKHVNSDMIYVNEYKQKEEFIKGLKQDKQIWEINEIPQCNIYFNQRGAGCGKTYESIQLLNNINDAFLEKNTFIYLTKMHSAKEVIYNEFIEQSENNKLLNVNFEDEYSDHLCNKQYKINYVNNKTKSKCKMIIGTIDAFMMRLGNKTHNENDYFYGIIKSIKNDYAKDSKSLTFGQEYIKLCKETLIIIDEAQDLSPDYIQAIAKIMGSTHFDTYIIGDKLQSIWDENNVFTFLEKNNFPYPIQIHRFNGKNHVRRFHNQQFMKLVNNIIDFDKYNLPKITDICNTECKYKHVDNIVPYNVFEIPKIYVNDGDSEKINKVINKITDYIDKEVCENSYLPHNFMFIFPYLNKNELANKLESKLQEYWKSKFEDKKYNKNIVKKNKYWEKKWDTDKYIQYVHFHKSDEGKSINLKESEHSSRIMSIHASKGTGCEVVFLLGIDERSLHFYANITGSLQYDSLLHVAITRQKMKLYVGISGMGCDIYKRFNKHANICFDKTIEPELTTLTTSVKFSKFSSYNFTHSFAELDNKFNIGEYNNINDENNKNIIDWGHHIIRNAVFKYQFLICIYNNEKYDDSKDQFKAIIKNIITKDIKPVLYNEYYLQVDNLVSRDSKNKFIPLLYFESHKHTNYYKYKQIIIEFIKNIQTKLSKSIKQDKLPQLCPLESIILWHLIEICNEGKYANTTIMDIYNVIYCYEESFDSSNNIHKKYDCKCNESFINNNTNENLHNDIQNSIKNHYDKIETVTKLYNYYKEYIDDNFGEEFKYNILHGILHKAFDNHCDDKMSFHKKYWLIANSSSYVINFIFKPQINKTNFNETFVDIIHDNYLINNCSKKDQERFLNKKIIHCVVSLNNDKPLFYDINEKHKNNINELNTIVKNAIKNYYIESNNLLFRYYNYQIQHKPNDYKNGIKYILDKINELKTKKSVHIVKYVYDFIHNINLNLNNENKDEYKEYFENETIFCSKINITIDDFINKIINQNNDKDDIDF